MKQFVKLNDNFSHLSLGNVMLCVKDYSKNKTSTIQSEVFCAIFDIEEVNNSTVNNYCVGARRIADQYKEIYIRLRKKFSQDITVFENIVRNILTLVHGTIYQNKIEESKELQLIVKKLFNISKNDFYVNSEVTLLFKKLIEEKRFYECFCEMLMYAVLDKKQPLFENEKTKNVIETLLEHTDISALDLQNFLLLELNEGINFTHSIMNLAKNGNPYANYRLGIMEYQGEYAGFPRYDKAYEYFLKASLSHHPSAMWMIGSMLMKGRIGSQSNNDYKIAYEYFLRAKDLGNIASINSIGVCYKFGYGVEKDLEQALQYFLEASLFDYAYAYNNLGLHYESLGKFKKASEYYSKSALLNESYGCNRLGELYRLNGDKKLAYEYYLKAVDTSIQGRCRWASYNLAKYYYLEGDLSNNIVKNEEKAIRYLKESDSLIESLMELLIIYYKRRDLKKVEIYKKRIEQHENYDEIIRKRIELEINKIKEIKIV